MVRNLIGGHPNSAAIREHSGREQARAESAVVLDYAQRVQAALDWPGLNPLGHPDREGLGGYAPGWFPPSRVLVHAGKTFRHTPDEVLEYAITQRGNADRHLGDMEDLWVDTYPVPANCAPLYAIGTNGNHRNLVFRTIGYESVAGRVQPCAAGTWILAREHGRWLGLFLELGLVEIDDASSGYVRLLDPTSVVGWVLPAPDIPLRDVPCAVVDRFALLESVLGRIPDPRLDPLRSEQEIRHALIRAIPGYWLERAAAWATRLFRR